MSGNCIITLQYDHELEDINAYNFMLKLIDYDKIGTFEVK